ncbi:MAG: S41 family peptidase [Firmicutes bacterium]|nr:S41 family peptidase [Bacillota bacterium]
MAEIIFLAGAGNNYIQNNKLNEIEKILNEKYAGDFSHETFAEGAYYGAIKTLGDPYTTYMSAAETAAFVENIDGSISGVGVSIMANKSGNIEVVSVIPGSPAEAEGILPGDILIEVDGIKLNEDVQMASGLIKGESGKDVSVKVYRYSENKPLEFKMTRAKIEVPSVSGEMLGDNIAYIKISQFNRNTTEQFKAAFEKYITSETKGLVLDLRDNLGGRFDAAQQITDMLAPEGLMVYTVDKSGAKEEYYSDAASLGCPLAVLVNGYTASASEILSGAVQDMGAGVLVGEQTYGKGLVQGIFFLEDNSAVKVTIQKYYTPSGVCIQGKGLTPDYPVKNTGENDAQLEKAIEIILKQA